MTPTLRTQTSSALAAAVSAALLLAAVPLHAQTAAIDPADDHSAHHHPVAAPGLAAAPAEDGTSAQTALSDGEVVRWDAATGRLTLRHGELKNLAMPPMTMVFRMRQPTSVTLAPGAKVRFRAEDDRGSLVITHIEAGG